MKRAPLPFWLLSIAVIGMLGFSAFATSNAPPVGEAAFQLRALELELRFAESISLLVPEEDRPAEPPDTGEVAARVVELARAEGTPAPVKEQAAAIWEIFGGNGPPPAHELLPPEDKRSKLGELVDKASRGVEVPPEQRAALSDVDMSRWLRSRLLAHFETDGKLPSSNSAHAAAEKDFFGSALLLLGGQIFFGLVGCGLLLAAPFYRDRLPGQGLRFEMTSPFAPQWWSGWYALVVWLALYMMGGFIAGGLMAAWDGAAASQALLGLLVQLGAGLLALRFIGLQIVAAAPRKLPGVMNDLRVGLGPFDGRALVPLFWGLGAFCIAIPIVYAATWIQALLPLDSHLVTNPALVELIESDNLVEQVSILLSAVVAAAVFEEIIFRGVLYRHLRTRLGVRAAVLISAAVFSAIHPSLSTFLPLFALGCVLALVTERSGGLLPAMLLHAIWNGQQLLMAQLVYGG